VSKPPTQEERVLQLLRERRAEGLTPLAALELAQCMRLAAVVHTLKAKGYTITTEMVEVPSGKRVACYRLVPTVAVGQLGLPL
jgi:hypothetical protein